MSVRTFDYVICGAGTSGCAAAWGLATRFPGAKIALLEEGALGPLAPSSCAAGAATLTSKDAPLSRVPMLALCRESLARRGLYARQRTRLYRATVDFTRVGHPSIKEREMPLLRGRGVGGTHLFDDAQYLRGWPADYRDWDTRGDGWKWKDVLPAFQRLEGYDVRSIDLPAALQERSGKGGAAGIAEKGSVTRKVLHHSLLQPYFDAEHEELPGLSGPMPLTEASRLQARTELNQTFAEACRMAALPPLAPTGTVHQGSSGFGFNTSTITQHGVQWFSSDLLLSSGLVGDGANANGNGNGSNLSVFTGTQAVRLLPASEESEADKLRFTRILCADGSVFEAAKELILCMGPIETPALLQRSGIGEGRLLHRNRVPIRVDLPAVGSTMCDRPEVTLCYQFQDGLTESRSPSTPNRRYLRGEWRDYRRNIGSGDEAGHNIFANQCELSAFTDSPLSPPERPAFLVNFLAFPYDARYRCPRLYDGYSLRMQLAHPSSRGWVDGVTPTKHHNRGAAARGRGAWRLSSRQDPIVSLGFMHEAVDRESMNDGIEWAQYLSSIDRVVGVMSVYAEMQNFQPASPYYKLHVDVRQPKRDLFTHSQRALWTAEAGYSSGMHLYGTCPMGTVVDERCRVLGTEGLRICGSAIIPVTVSGKISAISMMTAVRLTTELL